MQWPPPPSRDISMILKSRDTFLFTVHASEYPSRLGRLLTQSVYEAPNLIANMSIYLLLLKAMYLTTSPVYNSKLLLSYCCNSISSVHRTGFAGSWQVLLD